MQKKFQDLLHRYKVGVFHSEHDKKSLEELTTECMHLTEEVLAQKYHYHFHKLPDANRVEIINMINSYVREALLPPIVERIVARQLRQEKRLHAMEDLLKDVLEALSSPPAKQAVP
jgi:hypothetical protein